MAKKRGTRHEQLRESTRAPFIEADQAKGRRFRIRAIRAGLSGNRNFYPDQVLREAVPLFHKVRVFVKSDAEHLAGGGKDVRNLIGRLVEPAFVEGQAPDSGEVQATFEVLESAGEIAAKIREAHERDMADIFGFSIDAMGRSRTGRINGQAVRAASKISKINSVDLIVEPGAGGQVIELIEALQEEDIDMKLRARMLKLIEAKRPDLHAELDLEDEAAIEQAYREALATEAEEAAAEEAKKAAAAAGGGYSIS